MLRAQAFMFSRGFGRMLAATAQGNPSAIAAPVEWTGRLSAAVLAGPVTGSRLRVSCQVAMSLVAACLLMQIR